MPPFSRRVYPKHQELGSRATNPYESEGVGLVDKFLDFLVQKLEKDNKKSAFIDALRKAMQNNSTSASRINFNVEESVFKSFLRVFLEEKNVPDNDAEMLKVLNYLISELVNKGFVVIIPDENKPELDNYQITFELIEKLKRRPNSNQKQPK